MSLYLPPVVSRINFLIHSDIFEQLRGRRRWTPFSLFQLFYWVTCSMWCFLISNRLAIHENNNPSSARLRKCIVFGVSTGLLLRGTVLRSGSLQLRPCFGRPNEVEELIRVTEDLIRQFDLPKAVIDSVRRHVLVLFIVVASVSVGMIVFDFTRWDMLDGPVVPFDPYFKNVPVELLLVA